VIPVVGVSAVPQCGSSFSWKDFFTRVLLQAKDPLTDLSMLASPQSHLFGSSHSEMLTDRMPVDKLRRATETAFHLRKTRWLVVDEAHHIFLNKDEHANQNSFETLKALAIQANITIVLCGTYKLIDIRDKSAQLVRRSDMINFERYLLTSPEDQASFKNVVHSMQEQLHLHARVDLDSHWDKLFLKSIGCVGVLKTWIAKAYAHALERGLDTFDLDFLMTFAHSNSSLITMAKDAMAGEERMRDISDQELLNLLTKGGDLSRTTSNVSENLKSHPRGMPPDSDASSSRHKRRVGERLPKRDPVGTFGKAA
jgi:hypothetical protein